MCCDRPWRTNDEEILLSPKLYEPTVPSKGNPLVLLPQVIRWWTNPSRDAEGIHFWRTSAAGSLLAWSFFELAHLLMEAVVVRLPTMNLSWMNQMRGAEEILHDVRTTFVGAKRHDVCLGELSSLDEVVVEAPFLVRDLVDVLVTFARF